MPITVVHNAPASVVGGMGALAGNADYIRFMYPQLVQQDQFAQQMQQRQNETLFGAAQQQYLQAQQQAFLADQHQQQNQQQLLLGQQHGNYSLAQQYLHGLAQNQNQQDLFAQQDQRDQNAQAARAALDMQHQQSILERRNSFEEQQRKAAEDAQWEKRFYDPFGEYDSQVAKLQQAGMEYSPEQQKQVQVLRDRIAKTQGAVSNGDYHWDDVKPTLKADIGALYRIKPTIQKTTPQEDWRTNSVDVYGKKWTGEMDQDGKPVMVDDPTQYLGTVTQGPKGWSQTVRAQGGKSTSSQAAQGGDQSDPWAAVHPEKQVAAVEAIRKGMAATELSRQKWVESRAMMTGVANNPAAMAALDAEAAKRFPSMYNAGNVPPMIRDAFQQQQGQSGQQQPGAPNPNVPQQQPDQPQMIGQPQQSQYQGQITPDMKPEQIAHTPEFSERVLPSVLKLIDPGQGEAVDPKEAMAHIRQVQQIMDTVSSDNWTPGWLAAEQKMREYVLGFNRSKR